MPRRDVDPVLELYYYNPLRGRFLHRPCYLFAGIYGGMGADSVVDGTTEQQPNGCMIRHDHHRHTWIVHEPMVTCEKCVKIHDQQILRETFPRLNQTGEGFLLIFVDRIITNFMGCDEKFTRC